MTPLTVDADLRARLRGLTDHLELRDESGEVLGHYIPGRKGPVRLLPADACPYSLDDLVRMRNESGGKSLAEIVKQLEAK